MPKIRFTESPKIPRDMAQVWNYKLGDEVEVGDLEANRWLDRGVAELVIDVVEEKKVVAPPPPPPIETKVVETVVNTETITGETSVTSSGTVAAPIVVHNRR